MESKRRFGDRKDGRLIQSLAPFYKFMPYIMPTKNDACNQFEDCIEITNTDRWLRQKRLEGYKGLGLHPHGLPPPRHQPLRGRPAHLCTQQHRGRADRAPQHVHHLE